MYGNHLTKLLNGFSSIGKSKVNTNNEIIPELQFQQQRFSGGLAKRFFEYNTIIKKEEEVSEIKIERTGKGALYIHGKNTPYYSGDLIYNKTTERFSVKFEQIDYPVFSDCIIFKRITTDRDKVGRIYGSHPNGRIRDYSAANIAQGIVYVKRFEYQSITKSSLDQETTFRRDKNYYSKVFYEFYEKGRVKEFEKKLCCHKCGKFYYTGNLMPEENSTCIALRNDQYATGVFYTVDNNNRLVTNPQHPQYVSNEMVENLKNYSLINFRDLDITKYDYDYRILYYPHWYFIGAHISYYQGSTALKRCNTRYGLTNTDQPITVDDFAKKNNFFYESYADFMYKIVNSNSAWASIFVPTVEEKTQINQTIRHREEYAWEAMSWHSPEGGTYLDGALPFHYFEYKLNGSGLSYGVFYTDEGDDEIISCRDLPGLISNAGGALHGGAEQGYSTSRTCGHHWKKYSHASFEVAEYFKRGYTENSMNQGGFISDPDASIPLTEEELLENGITPKNETTSVDEIIKENLARGLIDPFKVIMVANFSTENINMQCYTPHVFTNTQKYNSIGKTEERLVVEGQRFFDSDFDTNYQYTGIRYIDNFLDYVTLKLLRKDENGKAATQGSDGYVFLTDYNLSDVYLAYRLKQKYTTNSCLLYVRGSDKPGDVPIGIYQYHTKDIDIDFADGSEYVYWYAKNEKIEELTNANMALASNLSDDPELDNGDKEKKANLDDGFEFRVVNQRICAAYGKYEFLTVGTPGLISSVFNKYIFVDFLPDKDLAYELEKEMDEKMDHNELDDASELNSDIPDLFRPMTEEEYDNALKKFRNKYYPGSSIEIEINRPSLKFTCESEGNPYPYECGSKNVRVSFNTRSVDTEYPWILVDWRTTDDGYSYNTYEIDLTPGKSNFNPGDWTIPEKINDGYNGINNTSIDEESDFQTGDNIKDAENKNQKKYEISPVWKNVSIPSYYYQGFNNLNIVASSYAEYLMCATKTKGKLLVGYNASPAIQRPWSGNIVTAAGCCPVRARNKYFIFDSKTTNFDGSSKKRWAPTFNTPAMQNRFFSSGATYVNYLGEGVYPHPDGDKFILISSWFTDAYEGFSGIQLKFDNNFTNFADGICTTGFNQSCDSALICTYNITGPLLSAHNIFSTDTDNNKYPTNKGVFPIIKGLWQPDKDSYIFKEIEHALFMIETQCMIEGPEYYFSTDKNDMPPGFSENYTGYKSRGLILAVKYKDSDKYKNYVIDSKKTGFFDYFEKQNEKRKKINCRMAYDTMPKAMSGKRGYYWDCEEAFGLYEISSPFAFETQLAAKMSFSVRVGDKIAVLFLLAYDIDKWPANVEKDNPTNDNAFPEIYENEEYSFKSAFLPILINENFSPLKKFTNFIMQYCLRDLATKKSKSESRLKKEGYKYFKEKNTTYPGIILPLSYGTKTGYKIMPQYIYNTKKDEKNQIRRGIVRLVRWRTMEWKAPITNSKGEIKFNNDDEVEIEEYEGAIAQCAISFNRPLKETVDQYYVGETVLICFYQKKGSNDVQVKNLHIPKQMVWQEDITSQELLAAGQHDFKEQLINVSSLGMIDTVVIEKKITKKKNKKDEEEAKLFEVLAIPVVTSDNQTYLAVTKDCEFWEIAGEVGSGNQVHLAAEFMENKETEK